MISEDTLQQLKKTFTGELHSDSLHKAIYATDASVYRALPLAVAYPASKEDIRTLIMFANRHGVPLIPRTAGTSLAGQCVGEGIIVDVSRHFTQVIAIDEKERTVTVEPGVIRDELNEILKPMGLFFSPTTSTSNRCMIGGMTGNNSSGTTSIKYGVTRDKVLEIEAFLSDGSEVVFKELSTEAYLEKIASPGLEGTIYKTIHEALALPEVQETIRTTYPKASIHRRNTGYAIDELVNMQPFCKDGAAYNLCKLLTGSEGTLVFITKITLKVDALPPPKKAMVAAHFASIEACCKAVAPLMAHDLYTCEMMDKVILDCTKNNMSQMPNRFFVNGDPAAILLLEVCAEDSEELAKKQESLLSTIESLGLSYAHPCLYGDDINKALELRKAGLGLLGNIVGDRKAVACIEDTAVALEDLAAYIGEFSALMKKFGQEAVYYAHAGAGELHLRPILNLKKETDVHLFRQISAEVAQLVKKYNGSLCGEHGNGRVRSEFIREMIGGAHYEILKRIKAAFDPHDIFNPGKIVEAVPMDVSLRYVPERAEPEVETFLDFSDAMGILRAAEQCNGSGDCRKTHHFPGAMCPSYHATKQEKDTTRARANALREFLTKPGQKNPFNHPELKEVFDLCLGCKACASECPSNIDATAFKTEFLHQYHIENGASLQDKAFAHATHLNRVASFFPHIANAVFRNRFMGSLLKKWIGMAPKRTFPRLARVNFTGFLKQFRGVVTQPRRVILFIDEFTRYTDGAIGKDAIELLRRLGYGVELFYGDSGRSFLSKGFLQQAQKRADRNIAYLKGRVSAEKVLVGVEPSALLSFRDEYPRLATDREGAKELAPHTKLVEEFLADEIKSGAIQSSSFTQLAKTIKIHAHCHQKALSNQKVTFDALNLPQNYTVTLIPSGCCGMAGSFGYEKQHYELSMKIGELKLFPTLRKASEDVIIAANGTSCREQIFQGAGKIAKHPVTILKEALL